MEPNDWLILVGSYELSGHARHGNTGEELRDDVIFTGRLGAKIPLEETLEATPGNRPALNVHYCRLSDDTSDRPLHHTDLLHNSKTDKHKPKGAEALDHTYQSELRKVRCVILKQPL